MILEVGIDLTMNRGQKLLVPVGIPTPHQTPVSFSVDGGDIRLTGEVTTGQVAALITPSDYDRLTLKYAFADGGSGYPDIMFAPRKNRFTKAADALVSGVREIADGAPDGHRAIERIVNAVAERFSYGHPDIRFNDGLDEVPYLACGLTEGSCVDINTYLIANLRAAGLEAGYVYGYFFPEEKQGTCEDGHCWVVTRHEGVVLEWDIAHHLKLGTREICCGLNPRPGMRVATSHSMGLTFPELGIVETKLLGEPAWVGPDGALGQAALDIRCVSPGKTAVAA
ncbi:transglutaminase superfamily protein [Roseibium hamelinense]|uniref:Transglutaminase superfamily protein n=1 Tax=Roseibium hamelinense TaxID=150831 RepID=A0A562TBD0_9HYPH|nr:transglutaminase-like domain-containing protein [Roseibium hamelinense]MTI45553.1 transglutaminase domain-containing protein [Roseibium hamelinense]TWI90070.1 transglutaminase superfamily protein [Roseibium hamelinense]